MIRGTGDRKIAEEFFAKPAVVAAKWRRKVDRSDFLFEVIVDTDPSPVSSDFFGLVNWTASGTLSAVLVVVCSWLVQLIMAVLCHSPSQYFHAAPFYRHNLLDFCAAFGYPPGAFWGLLRLFSGV